MQIRSEEQDDEDKMKIALYGQKETLVSNQANENTQDGLNTDREHQRNHIADSLFTQGGSTERSPRNSPRDVNDSYVARIPQNLQNFELE